MRLFSQPEFLSSDLFKFGVLNVFPPQAQFGRAYNGNSQGGILGGVYMAVSTDIKFGVLGVTGGPYTSLLWRSRDFVKFAPSLQPRFDDGLAYISYFQLMQLLWDRSDPGGYFSAIAKNPLPNTPPKRIIIQHALGDEQVTYVGAYIEGRSIGCDMFNSNLHITEPGEVVFGFNGVPDDQPYHGSCMQMTWVFPNIPPVPRTDVAPALPKSFDTHGFPRKRPEMISQMATFFYTGEIINTCGSTGCNATAIDGL